MKVSRHGRFRIQSVAEMTGVPASTLRAWEQRYGFPAPERTASAYRVYSDEDVQRIARVRELCDAGMAPAEAVTEVMRADAAPRAREPPPPAPARSAPPIAIAEPSPLVDRIVAAADAADPSTLDELLRSAVLLGAPAHVWSTVLAPAWTAVRQRSIAGDLDAGAERIATEILGHVARDLVRLGQPSPATGHAVLACSPDDDDPVPLLPAAFSAQAGRLRAVLLAPRPSVAAIAAAADRLDAAFVAIAFVEPHGPRRIRELVEDLARSLGDRRWLACGPAATYNAELVVRSGGEILEDAASLGDGGARSDR